MSRFFILEKKPGKEYTCETIIGTLKEMNMPVISGEGFIPEYTRTGLTEKFHDTFGNEDVGPHFLKLSDFSGGDREDIKGRKTPDS